MFGFSLLDDTHQLHTGDCRADAKYIPSPAYLKADQGSEARELAADPS